VTRRNRRFLVTVLVLAASISFHTGDALANHVSCGQVLTQNTVLDSDLFCSSSHGVELGADNIVLDMNGHSIGSPRFTCCSSGVRSANRSGVTIENGTIFHFVWGMQIFGGQGNTVRGMTIFPDEIGIDLQHTQTNLVEGNFVAGSASHEINVCCALDTSPPGGNNQILGNTLRGGASGIHLDTASNLAARNVVLGAGEGIRVSRAAGNTVQDNALFDIPGKYPLTVGVSLYRFASNTIVERNYVDGARLAGVYGYGGNLTSNVIRNNRLLMGLNGVYLAGETSRPSSGNQVLGNLASSNTGDGILITVDTGAPLVQGNVTNRNGDDGIQVNEPGTTLTGNSANYNADLGIGAVAGVVDGGGNTATGNGDPAQCVNVACP
jgi:hypothetical protein